MGEKARESRGSKVKRAKMHVQEASAGLEPDRRAGLDLMQDSTAGRRKRPALVEHVSQSNPVFLYGRTQSADLHGTRESNSITACAANCK